MKERKKKKREITATLLVLCVGCGGEGAEWAMAFAWGSPGLCSFDSKKTTFTI